MHVALNSCSPALHRFEYLCNRHSTAHGCQCPVQPLLVIWHVLSGMHDLTTAETFLQVHKAVVRVHGKPTPVAVKVRHPGVERRIIQDFQLLIPLARTTSKVKALKVHAAQSCV